MKTLFIDTHFKNIKLCLFNDEEIIDYLEELNVKSTSEVTQVKIKELLEKNNIEVKELDNILICNGPGSFTGVRIGVTIAKTLAYLLNSKIYTIDSITLSALNNKGKNYYGVKENNGAYIALFDDENLSGEIVYKKNAQIEDNVIFNDEIDYKKLITSKNLWKQTDCYNANPLYVKNVEGINGKKNNN